MPDQEIQATAQRRNLVLNTIRKLSGISQRWVTNAEIVKDLKGQGYAVKTHNIRRDLAALLPIHQQLEINDNSKAEEGPKSGLAYGYRWAGKDVEPTIGITLPEALSLVMVEKYLAQSLPVLLTQSLNDVFSKAHQTLELHKKSQVTHWPDKISVIQPAQTLISPVINEQVLTAVHEALLNEKQIQVVYKAANRTEQIEKTYRLHPLGIIQRGPVSYLAAMANDYETPFMYALHRMKSAKLLEQDSRQKEDFNLNDYATKQGHFGSGELIKFKARLCDHLAIMLEETLLDASQQITAKNELGYRYITATIPNTWQLRWWVLGEGERIEVLEPECLRNEIIRTLQQANNHYSAEYENDELTLKK